MRVSIGAGPRAVQAGHDPHRPQGPAVGHRRVDRGGAGDCGGDWPVGTPRTTEHTCAHAAPARQPACQTNKHVCFRGKHATAGSMHARVCECAVHACAWASAQATHSPSSPFYPLPLLRCSHLLVIARPVYMCSPPLLRCSYPLIIRPAFTCGGAGGGIAYNVDEFRRIVAEGLDASMTNQVLVEMSLIGWKEFELEVRPGGGRGWGCFGLGFVVLGLGAVVLG
eukprot:356915-Chlamydomonas_euryale.AAC.8